MSLTNAMCESFWTQLMGNDGFCMCEAPSQPFIVSFILPLAPREKLPEAKKMKIGNKMFSENYPSRFLYTRIYFLLNKDIFERRSGRNKGRNEDLILFSMRTASLSYLNWLLMNWTIARVH